MNSSVSEPLIDDAVDAYVEWREECVEVRDAYRRWSTAPVSHVTNAFHEYVAALNNEEHAANRYAQLIRRVASRHPSGRRTSATSGTRGRLDRGGDAAAGSHTFSSTEEKPMEFLVEFEVNVPDGTPKRDVDARNSAEASAAARLVDEGHLVRLWKPPVAPGESKALGLYRADSEAQLAGLLGALPLFDWMHVTVTPLALHPNDPAPEATVSAAAGARS
jgi:muconolactone D-isomerase